MCDCDMCSLPEHSSQCPLQNTKIYKNRTLEGKSKYSSVEVKILKLQPVEVHLRLYLQPCLSDLVIKCNCNRKRGSPELTSATCTCELNTL